MNWLLIIVLFFLAWNIVAGYQKGFLRVVYYLVEWVLIMAFVTWATPYVSDFLIKNTPIQSTIETRCADWLQSYVQNNPTDNPAQEVQVGGLNLPSVIIEKLSDGNQVADQLLEQTGVYDTVAKNLSTMAMRGIVYAVIMVIAMILFWWVGKMLKLVDYIPVLSGVNNLLGLFAGALRVLFLVWLFMAAVAIFRTTAFGNTMIPYIYEAKILTWLYDNNLLLNILASFL